LQPQPQQFEHPPVRDPTTHLSEQPVVVDLAEKIGDIELDHELVALDEAGTQPLHRLRGRPLQPKPIRTRHKVRLENRFQHDLGRRLGHPIPHRRNPQRPLTTSWFLDLHPTRRRRAVHALAKVTTQLTQHAVHAVILHRNQGDTIHPGRTLVLAHPLPRLYQDVTPVDTVIQGVETPTRRLLGRSP
jgi:hypothetical protein